MPDRVLGVLWPPFDRTDDVLVRVLKTARWALPNLHEDLAIYLSREIRQDVGPHVVPALARLPARGHASGARHRINEREALANRQRARRAGQPPALNHI